MLHGSIVGFRFQDAIEQPMDHFFLNGFVQLEWNVRIRFDGNG